MNRSLFALLFASACGTETGNPDEMVDVGFNARSSSADVVLGEDGRIRVDAVWLRLERTILQPCDAAAINYPGIGLGDHAGVDPAWQSLLAPDRAYCGLGAQAKGSDAPDDAIGGAAVFVQGRLADGRPFEVSWPEAIELVVQAEALPTDVPWLVTFDVALWLDIAALEDAPEPIVRLQGDPSRLLEGLALHADDNGSGTVDPDEERLDLPQ
jgi:hypothetical protein